VVRGSKKIMNLDAFNKPEEGANVVEDIQLACLKARNNSQTARDQVVFDLLSGKKTVDISVGDTEAVLFYFYKVRYNREWKNNAS
jgi:hypothetical protein